MKILYKIFPTGTEVSFVKMKEEIEKCLPEFSSVEGYGEEDIAFGLKALLAQIRFPEDKTGLLEKLEKALENIEGVSQVQTIMVRRASR